MKQVNIGDITEVLTGQSAPQDPNAFGESGIPFIRAGSLQDLQNGKREEDFKLINQDFAKKYRLKLFPKDTVIFAKSGMSAKLGRIYRLKTPSYLVSHLAAILPSEDLNPGYLERWLHKNPPSRLIPNDAYPSIKTSSIASMKIELPELGYQEHVAKILDKADALRQKRKESIKLLDDFLRSTFLEMFGDPINNPKGWVKKKLVDVGEIVTGNTPSRANNNYFGDHLEWIKTNNINTDEMYITPAKEFLSELGEKFGRIVPEGSILVTCIAGSRRVIGNAAIADRKVSINQQINALIPKNDNPIFLYYQFIIAKKYIQSFSTNAMKGMINKSKFGQIKFCLPKIGLQNKFADIVQQVELLKAKYKQSEKELNNLFGSLMQRAFKGEL